MLRRAEAYRDDLARFAAQLIQARSLSGDEAAGVDVIRKEMQTVGFDEVWTDRLGNIIGRIGEGARLLVMDAHIDTVDVGDSSAWSRPPFSGDIDSTWVHGRGAADQKSGMASMVYGMRILKDLSLMADCTVLIVGSVLEENCDGLCWRYMVEEEGLRPDVAVITEPTSLRIHRGHRGRIELNVRTHGVSAHASAPERGENAVYKMARIVGALEALNDHLSDDPFLGKGSLVVSQIMSVSPSVNAVPDQCTI
ncbi:MAG TPA: YgeY family selenium metabolism-linked hydrolase, partial [Candidatus Acetothermia bacterium]|nr:YgeY family selenium metabolism-linked hydrolase [Candidatus Acetothermia bacterium]